MKNKREPKTKKQKPTLVFDFTYIPKAKTPFLNMLDNLLEHGFTKTHDDDDAIVLTGHNMEVLIADYNNSYFAGLVYAERTECFNKWSQAPIIVKLPTTKGQIKKIAQLLTWLHSPLGLESSTKYDFENWVDERMLCDKNTDKKVKRKLKEKGGYPY